MTTHESGSPTHSRKACGRILQRAYGGELDSYIEIKSFIDTSNVSEFHTAVRQFLNYRVTLEENKSEGILYFAVPMGVYHKFFILPFLQTVIKGFQKPSFPSNRLLSIAAEPSNSKSHQQHLYSHEKGTLLSKHD